MTPPGLPTSATPGITAVIGFVVYMCASAIGIRLASTETPVYLLMVGVLSTTWLAMALVDMASLQNRGWVTAGLNFAASSYSFARATTKLIGLLASIGFVGLLYWIFPEYHGSFYDPYFRLLEMALPLVLICAVPYIYFVDGNMDSPKDGYWHTGNVLMFQWGAVDWSAVRQNLSAWLVKGFFLPLMLIFMFNDLSWLARQDFSNLRGFVNHYDVLFRLIFYVDVGFAVIGYASSFRLINSHVRSTEPSMLGWVVALLCYPPFWPSVISPFYINYESGLKWDTWLRSSGPLMEIWGVAILLLCLVYVWATVSFGTKFSNLTNRGIITNGPYRWLKHPAYVAKNLSWWMISVPFVVQGSPSEALRHCILLGMLNGVYWMRARTEEKHLMTDPVYKAYSAWIDRHGLYAILIRPLLGKLRSLS